MQDIDLSVIIPTYNSEKYIDKTLNCLLASFNYQLERIEVIIIDDGSEDRTVDIINEYAKQYATISVYVQNHHGVSWARNAGLKRARGKYVLFSDSDDLFEIGFLGFFKKQVLLSPDIILEDVKNLKEDIFWENLTDEQALYAMQVNLRVSKVQLDWGIGSRIYKRKFLIEQNLTFDPHIVVSEDLLFILEAISKARSLLISPRKFYLLQESHTLFRYNKLNLRSELEFRRKMSQLVSQYQVPEARDINNRTKLTGFIFLIDSYYGPLYSNNKISLNQASSDLRIIADKYFYDTAFSESKFDNYLSRKAPIYRKLLKHRLYKPVLLLNRMIDFLFKIQR